ncbi:MAG TPA: YegS/Rv2252/BmrU family lipid kinase [Pyrinomonadaceae bacterium]|nr:YegS/Rv2252/BmrU family lipid kinase [Pyrinomonadaceae bacterium]
MTSKRTAILISNPNAGRGGRRRAREVTRLREALAALGVDLEVWNTRAPGDATRLAREAAATAREIIVSGGDGTINEALQGLTDATDARLGIWPAGTANVLARHLRLPFDAEGAAHAFAAGATRRITLGCAINETTGARRHFFLMAGVGLDASVVRGVRPRLKRRVGEAAYWYSGLGHLAHWRPRPFTVEIGRESFQATYAAIGKAPWYGGGLRITPGARLDATEFEVCLIDARSRLRYLYLLTHAMRETWAGERRDVRFLRTRHLRVTGEADVQADGELIGCLPMSFEVLPEGIDIVVPREPTDVLSGG